jgi:hypothetical protein
MADTKLSVSRYNLWKRICEEENILLVLMEQKRRLIEETEELEARMSAAASSPPPAPVEDDRSEEDAIFDEEDLIDMPAGDPRGTVRESRISLPLALHAGDEDTTRIEVGTTEG